MIQTLLNFKDYTIPEHIFFAAGCLMWIVVYFFTIKNIIKKQFIEVPLVTVCGNIAWEFLWSWVFITNMGSLFVWGYRIWFFMDCFIVYGLFRYGHKQLSVLPLKKRATLIIACCIICWLALLYFYIRNYDAPISKMGAYSGYILNLLISGLYISLFFRLNDKSLFSLPIAWSKGVGTVFISVFCFLHFNDWFLLTMCIINAILDAVYLVVFYTYKVEAPVHTEGIVSKLEVAIND